MTMSASPIELPLGLRLRLPFDFQLLNPDGDPFLYISDDPAAVHQLSLTLAYRGLAQWAVFRQKDPLHFSLSFRKGTLSAKTLELLQLGKGWHLMAGGLWSINVTEKPDSNDIGFHCQNLRGVMRTSDNGTEGLLFRKDQVKLVLPQISASPTGGDRATQVLFLPAQYILPDYLKFGFYGMRRQTLSVLRHPADPQNPIQVALVDGPPIKNDGLTRNSVRLRISNPQTQPLALTPRGQAGATKLSLTFNVSEITEESALTDSQNAGRIVCETAGGSKWHVADLSSRQGRAPGFSFTSDATAMAPNEAFDIVLSEIVSNTTANQANLMIRYENFPDPQYAKGQVVVTVPKTI